MKTRIYLVRHGESLGNLYQKALGHIDLDLSEHGYRQAAGTFEYLKDVHFDAVYTSPLKRAYHTILPHAEARGLTPVPLDDLREIHLGLWEDMYLADILHRWPYTFTEMWRANFGLCTPPKGEFAQDAATRCIRALTEIAERHKGQTVLVGGHAGIFRVACARLMGIPPENVGRDLPYMTNASFTTMTYEDGKFEIEQYSYDKHLAEIGTSGPKGF